jgi:hypothetical protein
MRLFALIMAWLSWAFLLNATVTGPLLFLFRDPPAAGSDGGEAALIWSAFFSGLISIAWVVCSQHFFQGKAAGELRTWPSVITFLLCRLLGMALLSGAILCASLAAHKQATQIGWISVAVGLAVLLYTARNPKGKANVITA